MLMIQCLFNWESHTGKLFEFLNTQHPKSNLHLKKQVNKQISFLRVLLINDEDQFCTSVFRR